MLTGVVMTFVSLIIGKRKK